MRGDNYIIFCEDLVFGNGLTRFGNGKNGFCGKDLTELFFEDKGFKGKSLTINGILK